MSFMVQSFCVMLFTPNLEGIFFSTSPPMIGLIASLAAIVRRVPTAYWAMDLNPDQLIALGKLKPTDFTARLIEAINRFILRQSSLIITLDRYMAQSLRSEMCKMRSCSCFRCGRTKNIWAMRRRRPSIRSA